MRKPTASGGDGTVKPAKTKVAKPKVATTERKTTLAKAKAKRTLAPAPQKQIRPRDPITGRELKVCEIVALELVRDIVSQRLRTGDGLPSEAQMLKRYRTSRFSLREALRLLEVQGLVSIRRGRGTGTTVGESHPSNLARTLTLHLHMRGATYEQLLQAWATTEPLLAQLAAENKDRDRVREAMTRFLGPGETPHNHDWTVEEGLGFHDAVAELADNPVLSLSLVAISAIQAQHIVSVTRRAALEDGLVHDHALLAQAIIAGNAEEARRLMSEHVQHIVQEFTSVWPRQVGERVEWR